MVKEGLVLRMADYYIKAFTEFLNSFQLVLIFWLKIIILVYFVKIIIYVNNAISGDPAFKEWLTPYLYFSTWKLEYLQLCFPRNVGIKAAETKK